MGYLATGWIGRVPVECRGTMVFVPQKQAWMFWGFPNRFLQRMQDAGAEVYIAGDAQFTGRQMLHGVDDPAQARKIPRGWKGGVSTDRVDLVGPVLKP